MKIRESYVSNSSSSSYIIEFKNLNDTITIDNHIFTVENLLDHINGFNWGDENSLEEVTTDEGFRNELISHLDNFLHFYSSSNNKDTLYGKLKDDIKNSKSIFARFSIGYHDYLGKFLYDEMIKEGVIIERDKILD